MGLLKMYQITFEISTATCIALLMMTKVSNDVEKSINHVDINDVMKVTPSVVKGAAGKL